MVTLPPGEEQEEVAKDLLGKGYYCYTQIARCSICVHGFIVFMLSYPAICHCSNSIGFIYHETECNLDQSFDLEDFIVNIHILKIEKAYPFTNKYTTKEFWSTIGCSSNSEGAVEYIYLIEPV